MIMDRQEERVSQRMTYALLELYSPILAISGVCEILQKEGVIEVFPALANIVDIVGALNPQVRYLYHNVSKEFDVNLPANTINQLNQYLAEWKKQERILISAKQEIARQRISGIKLANPELDALLYENLFGAISDLENILNYLASFDEGDLTESKDV